MRRPPRLMVYLIDSFRSAEGMAIPHMRSTFPGEEQSRVAAVQEGNLDGGGLSQRPASGLRVLEAAGEDPLVLGDETNLLQVELHETLLAGALSAGGVQAEALAVVLAKLLALHAGDGVGLALKGLNPDPILLAVGESGGGEALEVKTERGCGAELLANARQGGGELRGLVAEVLELEHFVDDLQLLGGAIVDDKSGVVEERLRRGGELMEFAEEELVFFAEAVEDEGGGGVEQEKRAKESREVKKQGGVVAGILIEDEVTSNEFEHIKNR